MRVGHDLYGTLMRFLPIVTTIFLWQAIFAGSGRSQIAGFDNRAIIAYYLLTMVARAFEGGRRGTAIGTLNFAGDLGKMAAPALVGLVALPFGWRAALLALGIFGLVFSVGVWLLTHTTQRSLNANAPAPGAA